MNDDRQTMDLGVGALIKTDGWTGRIVAFRRDSTGRGLTVLVDTGEDRLVTLLWRGFVGDVLSVKPPLSESEDETIPPLMAELPQQDQDRVMQTYGDVLQVDTGSRRGTPEQDRAAGRLDPRFDPLTTDVEQRIKEMVAVRRVRGTGGASRATLHRQRKAVRERGVSGLIHGNSKVHRNVLAEHDPAVVDCVTEFLRLHKGEARISTRKLVVRVAAELASRGLGADLSRRQVHQLVGEASRGLGLHGNAASRRTHSKKPLQVHGRHEVSAPGEMIQIDGTPTTIHVYVDGLGWQHAVILSAIDCYDREVVAIRVCVGASTARDVAMLLADITNPTVARSGWPYMLENWHGRPRLACIITPEEAEADGYGPIIGQKAAVVPSTIVLDNGSDMIATDLMASAAEMGITVVFCPPGTPHTKGIVEGFQNLVREVQSLLPGNKGENPTNHPMGIEDEALLTPQDLQDVLWEATLEIYRWRPHAGLADALGTRNPISPGEAFLNYMTELGGQLQAPTNPYRAIQAMRAHQCKVQDYGINVDRRVYDSPELRELAGYFKQGLGAAAKKITIFYDRNVTDHVLTRHPFTGAWLRIPRRGAQRSTERPWSELLTRELAKRAAKGGGPTLADPQLWEAEKRLAQRWRKGLFESRREQRLAAVEASRATDLAHDYSNLPDEMLQLMFGEEDTEPEPATYPDAQREPGDDETDEELFDYDEIEVEELLL